MFECQRAAGPGAVILGGKIATGHFPEITVHVAGADGSALAVVAQVLEQLLSRQLHAAAHEPGQTPIAQGDLVLHTALAAKLEANRRAMNIDVAGAQRSQPVGAVTARITWIADANQRRL